MAEIEVRQIVTVECPSPNCPNCPTPDKVVRDGWKHQQQRYECKGCGNHFLAEGKALRKQFPAYQVGSAIDAYYSGMSYKQTAEHLRDTHDIPEPSKATVHAWVKVYPRLAWPTCGATWGRMDSGHGDGQADQGPGGGGWGASGWPTRCRSRWAASGCGCGT